MSNTDYVHLHLHTDYSLLDGAIQIKPLAERVKELGMKACAMTDHGNMYGAVSFYKEMKAHDVKPLIGCEVYLAPGHRSDRSEVRKGGKPYNHMILIAKDREGYHNLVRLTSKAFKEGFYRKPRIDRELLSQFGGGLVGLSACLSGVPQAHLKEGRLEEAAKAAHEFEDILGKGNYFLEIQDHQLEDQIKINKDLIELSKKTGIPLVATNDAHYLNRDDYEAHDVMLCIGTGKTVNDPNRMRFGGPQWYVRSPEEMAQIFTHIPDAVSRTLEVAEMCDLKLPLGENQLPVFPIPREEGDITIDEYFEKVVRLGYEKRRETVWDRMLSEGKLKHSLAEYQQRVSTEIKTIKQMGFPSYFLIVWDFIKFAKDRRIPVGPGRGSAAGSLIAYCLEITDVDPLQYDLLFERFLNPERVSMPDIDIDFCVNGRGEVINHVTQLYGRESVCQIITFGTMASKAAIKDVGRALDMPYADVEKIAKLIPPPIRGRNVSITQAMETVPELKQAFDSDPQVKKVIDIAKRLEGCARHSSVHAAGVVISPKPLEELIPVAVNNKQEFTTQFEMSDLEKTGMLKMDFLGLTTLTIIDQCCRTIKEMYGRDICWSEIPQDDPKTYELFATGHTEAVFQFESVGMQEICRKLRPKSIEDLSALNALYRPGPLDGGMVDDFIDRYHGKKPVEHLVPEMEDILKNTYGILVYQEQIMQLAQRLGGYSLGEADLMRRAMGKKKREEMAVHEEKFISGCVKNKIPKKTAREIFRLMAQFADYGFNRCLTGDAEVVDADTGEMVAIRDVAEGRSAVSRTYSFDGERVFVNEIAEAFETGQKEVVEVETEDGLTIRCTLDHKFHTDEGYLPLREIIARGLELSFSPEVAEYAASCVEQFAAVTTGLSSIGTTLSANVPSWSARNSTTFSVKKTKIVRVTPVGVEKTYNMTMHAPHHNYFVNGLLSANSHSVAYAHVAYQTAYLKAHYPEHFYAAVMTNVTDDTAKIFKYASELRSQGIRMLPPDVNQSGPGFTPVERAVRYGLCAIKGLGQSAVGAIIEARQERPFRSIFDLAERVGEKGSGKRVLESLVCAGAFDSLKPEGEDLHSWRARLFACVDKALERGARARRDRDSKQVDMFGLASAGAEAEAEEPPLPVHGVEPWTHKDLLTREKAAVGFYVSGHPLEDFIEKIEQLNCVPVSELGSVEPNARVKVVGVVSDFTVRNTKKGDRYAYFRLEDLTGAGVKCVLWPEAFKTKGADAADDVLLVATGRCEGESGLTIVCDEVTALDKARVPMNSNGRPVYQGRLRANALVIEFPTCDDVLRAGESVAEALLAHPGDCEVFIDLHLAEENLTVRTRTAQFARVAPNKQLQETLQAAGVRVRWVE